MPISYEVEDDMASHVMPRLFSAHVRERRAQTCAPARAQLFSLCQPYAMPRHAGQQGFRLLFICLRATSARLPRHAAACRQYSPAIQHGNAADLRARADGPYLRHAQTAALHASA